MTNLFINGLSGKMGSSLKQVISKTKGISIVSSLVDSDVVIDFSRPESTIEILSQCEHNKLPIVIGTTGFNKEQIEKIKGASSNIPVLLSYNMSMGIYNLKKSIDAFLEQNNNELDCIILDIHHKDKIDSPSGTAIELKELIQNHSNSELIRSISIESERTSDVFGIHKIRFFNQDNDEYFKHEALSRNIFSEGAVYLAQSISDKPAGMYSLKDFFN